MRWLKKSYGTSKTMCNVDVAGDTFGVEGLNPCNECGLQKK